MIRAGWEWLATLIEGCRFVARWNAPAYAESRTGGVARTERAPAWFRVSALQVKMKTFDLLTLQADDAAVRMRRHLLVEFEIACREGGSRVYLAMNTIISSSC
ncbi:MAG: hypothetical protein LC126_19570 [Bryobacterales bacterium]|nr:hypothetical protein [Bryobacterales bacterium]